ncbi:MAG: tRNA pseudouridine(13) synthase TruD [Promethearchaeota archaeon]
MLDQKKEASSSKNFNEKEVEKFVGIQVYGTKKIERIGGVYKTLFKDFIVKEIDENGIILNLKEDYRFTSHSDNLTDNYTSFNLTKINKDTFEAIKLISKYLKIPNNTIYYSGLKDKQSISVQRISIKGNFLEDLRVLKINDLFVRNIFPTKKPVKLGSHQGNNFSVVIRNIEPKKGFKNNVEKLLNFISYFGFPNYFGLQRFGSYRPNSHIVGRFLLVGEYEKAYKEYVLNTYSYESDESRKVRNELKKDGELEKAYNDFPKIFHYERNMIRFLMRNPGDYEGAMKTLPINLNRLLISSFQSYLFNKMLSLRVKKGFPLFKPINGDVLCILDDYNGNITQIKYLYGETYDKQLEKALKLNRASIILPIIGANTRLDDFPLMKPIFKEIAKSENIKEDIFQSKFIQNTEFKGSIRAMTVKPNGLRLLELTDDDINPGKKKIIIEFSLQKGSYATMLIREFIK